MSTYLLGKKNSQEYLFPGKLRLEGSIYLQLHRTYFQEEGTKLQEKGSPHEFDFKYFSQKNKKTLIKL